MNTNNSYTPNEIERFAYISGNTTLAKAAAEWADNEAALEESVDEHTIALEAAHEAGRIEGLETDAQAEIGELKDQVAALTARLEKARATLQAVPDWLAVGGACSHAKGRKEVARNLRYTYF